MRPDIAYVGTLSRHIACPAKSQAVKSVFRYLRQYKLTFQAENSMPYINKKETYIDKRKHIYIKGKCFSSLQQLSDTTDCGRAPCHKLLIQKRQLLRSWTLLFYLHSSRYYVEPAYGYCRAERVFTTDKVSKSCCPIVSPHISIMLVES